MERGGEIRLSFTFDLRGAIEEEIRKVLSDIVLHLTPVKPTKDTFDRCYCGNCDEMISRGDNFCHNCGRKVLWD